jgi:hypothetical protein
MQLIQNLPNLGISSEPFRTNPSDTILDGNGALFRLPPLLNITDQFFRAHLIKPLIHSCGEHLVGPGRFPNETPRPLLMRQSYSLLT